MNRRLGLPGPVRDRLLPVGLCLVLAAGAVVAGVQLTSSVTAEATAPAWSVLPSPNQVVGNDALNGLSCITARDCVAVGTYQSNHSYTAVNRTLVQAWHGEAWSIVPSPDPGRASNILQGVSCWSAGRCAAVGSYQAGPISRVLTELWNGKVWSPVVGLDGGPDNARLNSVSCMADGVCMAVGSVLSQGVEHSLVERLAGTTWHLMAVPAQGRGDNELQGVSCPTNSRCTATGFSVDPSGLDRPLIESWNGTSWSVSISPRFSHGESQLNGVSCASTTRCAAVGSQDVTGLPRTLVESMSDGTWSIAPSPAPAGESVLNAVACGGPDDCVASGYHFVQKKGARHDNSTLMESWTGARWTIAQSQQRGGGSNILQAAACAHVGQCMAVGTDCPQLTCLGAGTPNTQTLIETSMPIISHKVLPRGQVGRPYGTHLGIGTNGTTPFDWRVSSGALPAGLHLNPANGAISGVPARPGASGFQVQVSDGTSPQGISPATKFAITVGRGAPSLDLSASPPHRQQIGKEIVLTARVAAVSGIPPAAGPVVFRHGSATLCARTLRSGLASCSVRAGLLGRGSTTVSVTYPGGRRWLPASASIAYTTVTGTPAPVIDHVGLPAAELGHWYSAKLRTVGAPVPPVEWALGGGALPTGLHLGAGGTITGVATELGTAHFQVRVADGTSPRRTSAATGFSLTVGRGPPPLTLSASPPRRQVLGKSVVFTAEIPSVDGLPPGAGPVTFRRGTGTLCSKTLQGGRASCTVPAAGLGAGPTRVSVSYPGGAHWLPGTVTIPYSTLATASTMVLQVSPPSPARLGVRVTLSAVVRGPVGRPSGTVSFVRSGPGDQVLCQSVKLVAGRATCNTLTGVIGAGTRTLVARYSGSRSYVPVNAQIPYHVVG